MHLQVVGFMVVPFAEDHGEITNLSARDQVCASSRSHGAVIPPCPYYLNIKSHQLSSACKAAVFVVGLIAAMLGD